MRLSRFSPWMLAGIAVAVLAAIGLAHYAMRGDAQHPRKQARGADASPRPRASQVSDAAPSQPVSAVAAGARVGPARSMIIGGGALPESTEVSLEQNVQLAIELLPPPHAVFFAGGPNTQSVRVEAREHERDQAGPRGSLAVRLGELFSPRKGRTSQYRASALKDAARADLETLQEALRAALAEPTREPLVVYIAAHGDQGEQPADNAVATWGNGSLTPRIVAELHDGSSRELRLIVTSCFSGGFAELAFEAADAKRGAAHAPRCGLFAGTWDRETSGCDPDPDRSVQESYSQHLLNALAQRDHKGQPLALQTLDLDHDGVVSLLEAHTRARIASRSIDVPTTTSERFLREVVSDARALAHPKALSMPEDQAVVRELGAALGLRTPTEAKNKLDALSAARAALDERVVEAEEALDAAYWALATALLERFPLLDDPYHPAFASTLTEQSAAIELLLAGSAEASAHRAASGALDVLDQQALDLELQETLALRVVRAHETLRLAAALHARGGREWARYQDLVGCERRAW